jgi:hypothetical protein
MPRDSRASSPSARRAERAVLGPHQRDGCRVFEPFILVDSDFCGHCLTDRGQDFTPYVRCFVPRLRASAGRQRGRTIWPAVEAVSVNSAQGGRPRRMPVGAPLWPSRTLNNSITFRVAASAWVRRSASATSRYAMSYCSSSAACACPCSVARSSRRDKEPSSRCLSRQRSSSSAFALAWAIANRAARRSPAMSASIPLPVTLVSASANCPRHRDPWEIRVR